MISKSILIPLFAVLVVYCSHILGHSIRDSDHPLRPIQETLVQAFEKAKLPTTLQYFANKREIGIRYNTKYGPRIATFPGDITVGVLNSELSKNTHLGDNCSLKSNSFATVSEVYPASDALSFDVDLTLQCQVNENTLEHINDSNAVDKYDARTIINYLLRPAMFSEDYIPADIKEKLADYSYLAFHKDCSSPDAPSNCIELQGMRLASKGLDASETPNYYRDAADYLYTSYAGVTNWVREFAEWHKGPLHEFYNYLDPVHAKSHTGIYGLNNGSIITADKSKSLGLSGIRALKLIANAYDTLEPEKAEELVVQIIQTFAPNSVDEIRISMTGDWASGTHESHLVALLLRRETKPHWTFHLGDIYFTGNPSEIEHNILGVVPPNAQKAVTWTHGTLGSFAFPGNHEYYSMGNGFYKNWLPALGTYNEHGAISGQKATYASFENEFWRIIGIDTGYSTFDPIIEAHNTTQPIDVINWMRTTLNLENHKLGIDNRAIIIVGHHQYRSAFATQFLDTPKQLEEFLDLSKPVIWFWGHEHKLSIYHLGKVEDIELMAYGRCIGIGGYPTAHTPIPENARSNGLHAYDDRTWFIQSGDLGTYDQGFNGYASLKIKGLTASIEYRTLKLVKDTDKLDPITSEVVITESFTIEPKTGKIQHTSFEVVNPGIVIIDNIQPAGTDGRDINNGISRSYLEMKSKEKKEKKEKNCTHGDSVGVEDADIDTGNEKTTRHMGKPHLRGEDVEQYYREIIHMEL